MYKVISDKGHLRAIWDQQSRELIVKQGKLTTKFHIPIDGTVEAFDMWTDKRIESK